MVLPGVGSKCASDLFCASDPAVLSTRSCYLLWSHRDPPTEEQSPPLSPLLLLARVPSPGDVQEAGSVCAGDAEAALCPPTHSLSCPRPWSTQGSSPGQVWGKLLCQKMEWVGVLQLPRDQEYYRQWQPQAPHTSLSKEPCF